MLISLAIMSLAATVFALALVRNEVQWVEEDRAEEAPPESDLLPVLPLM